MTDEEIVVIGKALLAHGPQIDVLEWGSGGSTVYFTDFLRQHGVVYSWVSMEYNREWYKKITEAIGGDSQTEIVLFDVGNTDNKQRLISMDEYVSYPATLDKKFDVILVDGRKRRRCLVEALALLKPGGEVFLHDARRTYYHCAFSAYLDSQILLRSGLWRGRKENPGSFRRIVNFWRYWTFRAYSFSFRFKFWKI